MFLKRKILRPVAKASKALFQLIIISFAYLKEFSPNAHVIGVINITDITAVKNERVAITSLFVNSIGPLIPTLTKTPSIDQKNDVKPPKIIPTTMFVVIRFDSITAGNKTKSAEEIIVKKTPNQTFHGSFSFKRKFNIVIDIAGYNAVRIAP